MDRERLEKAMIDDPWGDPQGEDAAARLEAEITRVALELIYPEVDPWD